ncbi:MAG: YdeI/OmpD-associated family protein [Hyphomicrobium sp.]|nr:YdeI/OmpD-associated family protein [Hyphomicrobium sp.]
MAKKRTAPKVAVKTDDGQGAGKGERVEITSRAEWRSWLTRHHARRSSIWLVIWKKGRGSHVPYADIVDEALCFGWIDSRPAKLDENRSMLLLSPRKPKSGWSNINKQRVKRLIAEGLMADAGFSAIETAIANGAWRKLDDIETLVIPNDLAHALDEHPPSRKYFESFPPSSRRGILEWIASAKQLETRRARIENTARLAARNINGNFPEGRNLGPEPRRQPKSRSR